jgi:integrase
MPLTDIAIRKAKPIDKTQRLYDERGLYLEVAPAPTGSKLWRLKYRFDGKEKRLALGAYPDTTLADARNRRDEARRLLASGVDPNANRKAAKAARAAAVTNSFEVVAREWLAKQAFVPGYSTKVSAWFEKNVFPWIGARPVSELTGPEFLKVLRRVEDRGAFESAHRIKQNCGQVMRYAIATGRADRDPTADLKGALTRPPERHHAAITDPKELGGLLRAIDGFSGTLIVKSALQLAPLVFVRPNELCAAEWSEFDLDTAEWNVPAARMKTGQPHLVPLSKQAVAILRDLQPLTGSGRYTFPSARTPYPNASQRPMTTNALLAALQRIGYSGSEMTTHGFRATARTILDEHLNFRPDFIEHQLAHAVRDPNGRAYNRTAHLVERRKMMQAWASYLDDLRADTGKVVPMKRRASA